LFQNWSRTGPLGIGFAHPEDGRRPLHVGGGIGIVPLAGWQDEVGGAALLGFRTAEHAAGAALLRDALLATDDGSNGHHGPVTDLKGPRTDGSRALCHGGCLVLVVRAQSSLRAALLKSYS